MTSPTSLRPAATAIPPRHIPLIKAFEAVKQKSPELWAILSTSLNDYFQFELGHVIRCPCDLLQVAQGRAQISDDVIQLVGNCSELMKKLQVQQAAQAVPAPVVAKI